MQRSNATTLQDIAREVGVSAMTVSVVLHGSRSSARVSDATRTRIVDEAKRLRYRPNGVARGLNRRRMDTLGVVSVIDGGEVNLYFLEVLNGILEGAAERGHNITVFSVRDWQADAAKIQSFCDGRVDGMIFIAPHGVPADVMEAILSHTPVVALHASQNMPGAVNLDVDNEAGAFVAVTHLAEHGHRRIAHFTGGMDVPGARQRLAGYRRALDTAHIPCDEELVLTGNYSATSGRQRMEKLLAQCRVESLPTALFCASDAIAAGCIEALTAHGLRAPDDISVVGFDDTLNARMTTPPLTTVCQPFRGMGRRAVELLLIQLEDGSQTVCAEDAIPADALPQRVAEARQSLEVNISMEAAGTVSTLFHSEVFPLELVVRKSVGPPRPNVR